MENQPYIEKLATLFGQSASVKNVYGEPIQAGEKTIIPVARIIFGLGGGNGHGKIKNKAKHTQGSEDTKMKDGEGILGQGTGGGGAMYASPKGVYEITPTCTRFIPANNTKQLLLALAIGFVLKGWFFSKRRQFVR